MTSYSTVRYGVMNCMMVWMVASAAVDVDVNVICFDDVSILSLTNLCLYFPLLHPLCHSTK